MENFSVDSFDSFSITFSSQNDLKKAIELVFKEEDFLVDCEVSYPKPLLPEGVSSKVDKFSELIISSNIISKVKNGEFKLSSCEEVLK